MQLRESLFGQIGMEEQERVQHCETTEDLLVVYLANILSELETQRALLERVLAALGDR